MSPFMGELVGTMLLIILGDGVVANVLLAKSKGQNSGWIVITTGWGLAVFVGVYAVATISGAHLNPAITIGLAVAGSFGKQYFTGWQDVPVYIIAQLIGAFLGAVIVWLAYLPHWSGTEDKLLKRLVFSTAPAVRSLGKNLLTEIIGTFMLMFGVFALKGAALVNNSGSVTPINLGALGALPVALLVWAIGLSLGGPTGYAINPARDLSPRLAHWLLPIPGKGDSDWSYGLIVPVIGPIIGAILAALLWIALGRF